MPQNMTRTQIYIEPDMLLQAKLKAQTKGFNFSQYFRELIKEDLSLTKAEPNMAGKKIKSISIPGLKKGEVVYYSRDHNDIYDY
jgi:hypothetical protein